MCVVRSNVDAGDNLLTAEDIYNILEYGNRITNANISQVAIYDKNPVICKKTSVLKDQFHAILKNGSHDILVFEKNNLLYD